MENKFVLELIKKDLEELTILVDSLAKNDHPKQLLIDITKAKAETLLQEFNLLSANENTRATVQEAAIPDPVITPSSPVKEKEESEVIVPETPTEEVQAPISPSVEEINQELIAEVAEVPLVETIDTSQQDQADEEPIEVDATTPEMVEKIEEAAQKVKEVEPVPEPVSEPIKKEEPLKETPESVEIDVEPVKEIPKKETKEEAAVEEVKEQTTETVLESPRVLGEQFANKPSLNDRMAGTKTESKIKGKPVTSIKSAIGLNDRFMYTRELFDNNQAKFTTTVDALDQLPTLEAAVNYLDEHFTWPKNETSLKFITLVKQRFEN